jgi:tripartite-type tricarboxylate transporter receptor subunit TctC
MASRHLFAPLLLALAALAPMAVGAQPWPGKPVRLIVPFTPGGAVDFGARLVGQKINEAHGQPVVVDNRAGAGGAIGTELAARAVPDGYTLLLGSAGPMSVLPALSPRITYDPVKDFVPLTVVTRMPFLVVSHPSVPAATMKDFIALARARPGQFNYASAGNGSTNHLAGELLKSLAGIDLTHVPYKGVAPALNEVLAGQVPIMSGDLSTLLGQVKAGRLRALAVTGSKRSPLAPEVPTVAESGVTGYEAIGWLGLLAPARTPKDTLARIHATVAKGLAAQDARDRLATLGGETGGGPPEEFAALIRNDLAKWTKLGRQIGFKAGDG